MKVTVVLPTPPLGESTAIVLGRVIGGVWANCSSTAHSRRCISPLNLIRSELIARARAPEETGRPARIGCA